MNDNIINGSLKLPRFISENAADLIQRLLNRNPLERIGAGHDGASEIKAHPFFDTLNWDDIILKKGKLNFKKKKTVKRT
jgi:serine/threonine protein kinase